MKNKSIITVLALLLSIEATAQSCPAGYEQIYVLCNKMETPKCILPAKQAVCSQCWEIRYGPCEGKSGGGMRSFDTYQSALESAEADKEVDNSCPWYNDQEYRIVLNDPKNCLQKPTGNEMTSPAPPNGSGDMDDLLDELLNDSSIMAGDAGTKQQWEQVKKEIRDVLASPTLESKANSAASNNPATQKTAVRGLAGKIQSGEYNPSSSKDNSQHNNGGNGDRDNGNSAKAANPGSTDNQESYALFWIRTGTFTYGSPQIYVKLNGQYISVRPGSGKVIQGAMTTAPACGVQDQCDGSGWCGSVIRVKLTQTQNNWIAEEQHGGGQLSGHTQVWRGNFTTKPGCNIIEIK